MTTHEDRARRILEQAEQDNAEHPIGISKHRVSRIAEALAEGEAQRDRLAAALRESHGCVPCDGMEEMGECFVCEALAAIDDENGKLQNGDRFEPWNAERVLGVES